MLRATVVVRGPGVETEKVVDTLTLDHDARHRRRIALVAEGGLEFLLDLDRATVLDDGDAVKLEDGRLVRVRAAPERLIEIRADNPLRLMRVAWHIGNRHVVAELAEDAIYIAHDHVLMEMIRGLGAITTVIDRPFRPERGAYEAGGHSREHVHEHGDRGLSHGDDHHHGHDHDHDQAGAERR